MAQPPGDSSADGVAAPPSQALAISRTKRINQRANCKQTTVDKRLVPQWRDQPKKGKHEHKCNGCLSREICGENTRSYHQRNGLRPGRNCSAKRKSLPDCGIS